MEQKKLDKSSVELAVSGVRREDSSRKRPEMSVAQGLTMQGVWDGKGHIWWIEHSLKVEKNFVLSKILSLKFIIVFDVFDFWKAESIEQDIHVSKIASMKI